MKKNRLFLIAVTCLVALTAWAGPRTPEQMKAAAAKAINKQRAGKRMAPKKASELQTLRATATYQIIGQEQGGFAVISTDDLVPEVLGISMSKYNNENANFKWWLEAVEGAVQYAVANNVPLTTTKPDPTKYPESVAPMLTTFWDQLEPYNRLCPISSGGDRCYTGCVATAMAQVLNYHQTPEHGIGTRTIYYPQYNPSGTAVTANFEEDYYDWDNMLDSYDYGNYNEAEAMAVAVLMRDCGVAADMQYGGYAEAGSGAYSQDAAEGLRTYFGIADAECLERDNYSEPAWMDIVYKELSENGPCYYGGASWSSGGHAFVLHGYNEEGMVYVNWGWSGDDDGYYDIALLNPGYYQFHMGQDMIIGVKGAPRTLTEETVELAEAGTLSAQLGDDMIGTIGKLTVTGDINSTDLLQIRKFAGIDQNGERLKGYLSELDLSGARIVAGGEAYLIEGSKQYVTADDELTAKAFYGCRQLKTLKLPAGIKHFGDGALGLCPMLGTIEMGEIAADADFTIEEGVVWNLDKTEIISVLPNTSGELNIPKGTVNLHDYALAGCLRLTKVLVPSSVEKIGREGFRSCGGLSEIRMTVKDAPELGGADVFAGVNTSSSCKLYVPSGSKTKYAQKAQWSAFVGENHDNIIEYGTTVKVRNTIRKYGDENPQFTYYVVGDPLVGGEPVLTCEATPQSPAGKYPIVISAGTITDETVELEDGYLVVQRVNATATVMDATREEGQPNPEFTLTFEGLVNNDEVPVWIEEPVFVCEADENSPAGTYPIMVESAVAESYKFTFIAGTLTVTEGSSTGINGVRNGVRTEDGEYFTLDGRRVKNPTKGVYIHNGRKVVIK